MKKLLALIALLLVASLIAPACADFLLPASLTVIEEEAFMGDSSLSGVVSVPAQVEQIKKDAFSETNLFGLEIPENVQAVDSQSFTNAAYVLFSSSSTAFEALSGVRYIIAPDKSPAMTWAKKNNLESVSLSALVCHNGFYYRNEGYGLTLMSAVDPDSLESEVEIPEKIDSLEVIAISPFAFMRCAKVQKVTMPGDLLKDWNQSDHDEYTGIAFTEYTDPLVKMVRANVASGAVGNEVTWTVETEEHADIVSYNYSLYQNGTVIDEKNSSSASYTGSSLSEGAYQLKVVVMDRSGARGTGSSTVLYIAAESMKMNVPQSIQAGQDLTLRVLEVPGAYFYGVYLSDESTGKTLSYQTVNKAGEITFEGYLLDSGTYRVTGYVFGNDFRFTVPTVRTVTVTGTKAAGPEIENQQAVYLNNGFKVAMSGVEKHAIAFQYRYSDTTTSTEEIYAGDYDIWAYPFKAEYTKMEDSGGTLLIKRAIKDNGIWSAWGPTAEIEVLPAPKLSAPTVTCPEISEAGKDLSVSFESVENADWINVGLFSGHITDDFYGDTIPVFSNEYRKGQTIIIPGYNLDAGQYTLHVSAYSENGEFTSNWSIHYIDIVGVRPEAPSVTSDKAERYISGGNILLSIQAPGAEGAYVGRKFTKNGEERNYGYSLISTSLDENGNGIYRDSYNYDEDLVGYTLTYQVTVIRDGVWSEFGSADVLLKKQEPLPSPIIEAAETHVAGTDYTFRFSPVAEADYYEASFRQYYGGNSIYWWSSATAKPDHDLTVPGYYLTQGSYRLIVEAYSSERGSSSQELIITITGSRPSAPSVNVSIDEFHINDRPIFTIDTIDAEDLIVLYGRNDYQLSDRSRKQINITDDETTWKYSVSESYLGKDMSFSFSVKKGGVWSNWKEFTKTILNLPPLDAPVIHVNPSYEAGEDFSISFDPVDNAQMYEFYIYCNGEYIVDRSSSSAETIFCSGNRFEPGSCNISVIAQGNDYSSSKTEATFQITGKKNLWEIQPTISQSEVTPDDNFTFEFDTTNVDAIQYKRYDSNRDNYSSSGTINVLESTTRWTTSIGSTGEYYYVFSARINDRWTAWTSPIYITVVDEGTMVLPNVEVPDSLPLGKDLTVTLGSMDKARYMDIYLYNSNGTRIGYKYISGNTGGTVTFDGYGLSLGKNRVNVQIYTGNNWYYIEKQFSVTGNTRPQAPEVTPDTDVGRVNVRFGFTVNSTGADKIAIRCYQEDNTNDIYYDTKDATGDETYWYHTRTASGTVWKYAFSVRVNDTWSPWSQNYTVRISDREQLANTVIHAENNIEAGQDLYVSFDEVENAESYTMYLEYPNGSHSYWDSVIPNTERRFIGYDLTPGTYRIVVTASSLEYESSTTEKTVRITGSRPVAPEVHVSSQEVYPNETFTFVIDSAGANEVAYRRTYSGGWDDFGTLSVWMISDPTVWDTSVSGSGTVQYSFSTMKDGKWSAWSTPIEITVITRPTLDTPEITVPGSLTQGENLMVTVGEVENASYYYVYLYNNREQQITSKYLETAGSVVFSGYQIPLGSIRVYVRAYGNNNGTSSASKGLMVEAGVQPDAPFVTPPESLTVPPNTEFIFTINTESAEKAAVRYFRIGSPNNLSYSEFNVSGETTSWRGYQYYSSGNQYAYSFSVQKDGVWSVWSPFTVISIE